MQEIFSSEWSLGGLLLNSVRAQLLPSHLKVDFSKAVMHGRGVAQQQHSSVFHRLVEEGVEESGHADEPQRLPASGRQREVAVRDPAQRHPGAVRGDARQRVWPQPESEVRGRLEGGGHWRQGAFRCAGIWFRGRVRLFSLRLLRGSSRLGSLLLASSASFKGLSVWRLHRATGAGFFAQQLQVLSSRRADHGVELWFALGQQWQPHPHQTGPMCREKPRHCRHVEGRHPAACPLTFRSCWSAPTRKQP